MYSADVTKYGMQKFFKPFLLELKQLEKDEGVVFSVDSEVIVLRTCIACCSADRLAIHQMFGLLSPSDRHFCRQCMVSRVQLKSEELMNFQPRTRVLHQEQLR